MKKLLSNRNKLRKIKRNFGEKEANLTGVCEGIADYIGISPWYVRLGFVGFTIMSPWLAIPLYVGLAVFLPDGDDSQGTPWRDWGKGERPFAGLSRSPEKAEKEISYIICDSCQTAVEDDANYCHQCGVKI
ncbi:MAG: PspC domain-containing protein [Bacteroidota bacterium]